jgi:hypothetical protein
MYSKSLSKIKNQKATTIVSLTLKCETTKYMKRNKGKWDSRNEARKNYETKRNFAGFLVSRNKRNFAKQLFCFAMFRVSRNKKRMRNGNPKYAPVLHKDISHTV